MSCQRICRWLCIIFCFPLSLFATTPVKSLVIFGDSLSDTGNTTHLLKSLRQEEGAAYLVQPLKVFVINRMEEFASDHYVPQVILDAGLEKVRLFFDTELGPMLALMVSTISEAPVLPGEPYWQAHFSNGRVWNEYLAPMLSIDREDWQSFNNQAFGGSWAATYDYQLTTWNLIRHPLATLKTLIVGKLIPPSLGLTVQAYLLMNEHLDKDTVYFVFTGANDYMNMLAFAENYNSVAMSDYIDNVVDGIASGVNKLIKAGARHIVILAIPDITLSPRFLHSSDRPVLSAALNQHNERLEKRVAVWRETAPEVDFLYINPQLFLEKVLANPGNYGFSNTSDACIDVRLPMFQRLEPLPFAGNFVLEYAQVLHYRDPLFLSRDKNYTVCDIPEHYLFWDDIHPTTKAHQFLANEICEAMRGHGYQTSCQLPLQKFSF